MPRSTPSKVLPQHLVGDQTVFGYRQLVIYAGMLKFGTGALGRSAHAQGAAGNPAMSNTIGWVIFNNVPNQKRLGK